METPNLNLHLKLQSQNKKQNSPIVTMMANFIFKMSTKFQLAIVCVHVHIEAQIVFTFVLIVQNR